MADGLTPDPKLSVSEWAEENIYLPAVDSAEPGKYNLERTPFNREILDELGYTSRAQIVTVMKGAQLGLTTLGNIFISYIIGHQPGPILYVLPTLDTAKRTSKQRLQPMFDACPAVKGLVADQKAKDASNSVMMKVFPGGILVFAGANSASGLRSMPARYLILDESSGYDSDIENEGDPSELAKQRTVTFNRNRKIFQPSTPTVKGLDRIEREFENSDKRYYNVPCPHCKEIAPIWFSSDTRYGYEVKWDTTIDDDGVKTHHPESAHLICPACSGRIDEKHKTWMLQEKNGAKWIATAEGDKYHVGFHINSLYSPIGFYSWESAVSSFLEATRLAKMGDISKLKTFTNLILGETWYTKGTEISHSFIWNRREFYNAEVPAGVLYITAGIDVQKNRIEATTYGWGANSEVWAIEHKVIHGDPSNRSDKIYDKLDNFIFDTTYQHENGYGMKINCAGIDTGFLATQLYDYIRTRQNKGVFALKGDAGAEGALIVSPAAKAKEGRAKRPVNLFRVGNFESKRLIYAKLMLKDRGPGYVHYPVRDEFDDNFFKQLTAERIEEKLVKGFRKRRFVLKPGQKNEALDTFMYALATLQIANPPFKSLEQQASVKMETVKSTESKEEIKIKDNKYPIQQRRPKMRNSRRGKGGWTNNWG